MRAYQALSERRTKSLVISVPALLNTGCCLDGKKGQLARNVTAAVAQSPICRAIEIQTKILPISDLTK